MDMVCDSVDFYYRTIKIAANTTDILIKFFFNISLDPWVVFFSAKNKMYNNVCKRLCHLGPL